MKKNINNKSFPTVLKALRNSGLKKRRGQPVSKGVSVAYSNKMYTTPLSLNASKRGDDALITGSDWAEQVVIRVANDKVGSVISDINLNPFTMRTTRLAKIAALYEFWQIEELSITFVGGQPSTTPGVLTGFFDYDTSDDLTLTSISTRNLEIAHAHSDSVGSTKLWEKHTWTWNDKNNIRLKRLFTNPTVDPTCSSAGRFYLLTDIRAGVVTDVSVGTLIVRYKIKFHKPQLDDTLYGYACKWEADGGGISHTTPFGNEPVALWSNLPLAKDPAVDRFTLYPGNYAVSGVFEGTVITDFKIEAPSATLMPTKLISADQKSCMFVAQVMCTEQAEVKFVITATTVVDFAMVVASLPVEATRVKRELDECKRLLAKLDGRIRDYQHCIVPTCPASTTTSFLVVEEPEEKKPLVPICSRKK